MWFRKKSPERANVVLELAGKLAKQAKSHEEFVKSVNDFCVAVRNDIMVLNDRINRLEKTLVDAAEQSGNTIPLLPIKYN